MMVTFVSQCEKNALKRTRRVLDSFANRIGDNTWQTVITQEGLLAVKKLLRKTASKSTAVSCHWVRSRSRSELVWVVGKRDKFDLQGRVPVNRTVVNRVLRDDSADWHYLPLIQALAAMAALLHDWGKASERFQQKLQPGYKGPQWDALRHEWVSCILLKAFISTGEQSGDTDWLTRLAGGQLDEAALQSAELVKIQTPLKDLPPTAQLLAWLIVSHHRLPLDKNSTGGRAPTINDILDVLTSDSGYQNAFDVASVRACLRFPKGLVSDSSRWMKAVKRWAQKLLLLQSDIEQVIHDGSYRLILHHARLSLMLADHCYSSQDNDPSWRGGIELIANTKKDVASPQGRAPKQRLDQHLIRVCDYAKSNVRNLPTFEKQALRSHEVARLKKLSPYKVGEYDFRWQDKAVKRIKEWRSTQQEERTGFFAVNMASTGCGKTFANAKVMRALSDDGNSLRYILALGLRTLTLQTGDEYRERIFADGDGTDLAVMIGSKAVVELHQSDNAKNEKEDDPANLFGSESQQSLLDAADQIEYDGEIPEEGLSTVLQNSKDRQFLHAPVLVCTIDHIMPATETIRGGRYILPCLRLMSSDLVIDEIDDFTGSDSIAIGRLINLAGMLGRKVMISSATIPPAMAEGYFKAYQTGWQLYAKTRTAKPAVGCAWIDEFRTSVATITDVSPDAVLQYYSKHHEAFIEKRVASLATQEAKRKARIVHCDLLVEASEQDKKSAYFSTIARAITDKHACHSITDKETGLNLSFGVVRMANINPCIALTRYLLASEWAADTEVKVMPYHSQQVLLLRNAQEKHLDAVLKRKERAGESPHALSNRVIRQHLTAVRQQEPEKKHLIFILVATPVEEVGRDHDFDWAVIEPSSYRSIIQLAGRVKRHRSGEVSSENIALLQYNWKTIKEGNKALTPYFIRPGYDSSEKVLINGEKKTLCCRDHDLNKLLNTEAIAKRLDSVPRIQQPKKGSSLAMLEHAVINYQLNHRTEGFETLHGYLTQQWFLTGLCQQANRFRESEPRVQLYLAVNHENDSFFVGRDAEGNLLRDDVQGHLCNLESEYRITRTELTEAQLSRLWLARDYFALVEEQSEKLGISLLWASVRYGELSLRENVDSFIYNDQLGLFKEI